MSRTERTPRAPDSTPDAWTRHDEFHRQLDAPQVQNVLAIVKPHLHPIFLENALFCEETGMPTVPLNFLVEILEQSALVPRLPSHNFKLGLQLAISHDLSSPLHDSPSKHYSEQRIQFDTFVNAFAFSLFSYPFQLPQVDDSTSSQAQENPQDANSFATSLRLGAKHLSESVQSSSKAGASENTNTLYLKVMSKDPSAFSPPKPESLLEGIEQVTDLQTTKETILEQDPQSPIIQDDECSLHDSSTVRDDNTESESIGTFDTESSAPPTPAQYFTPRAHLEKPTPHKTFTSSSFASSPKNFAWFTPRQGVAEGSRTTPSNRFRRLLLTGERKKKQTPFKDSPRPRASEEFQFENNSQRDKEESPVQPMQKAGSGMAIDVTHSKQESEVGVETVRNVQDTTCASSSTQEKSVSSPERKVSVENLEHTSSGIDGDSLEPSIQKSTKNTSPQGDEIPSQRFSISSNLASPSLPSPSSQFQSPEIRDTFTTVQQSSLEDPSSSRRLSFSDSEDGSNSLDESSPYETDEERSTPEMKLSQASNYGQNIEEPEIASELGSLAESERGESDVHREEGHIESRNFVQEVDDHSPQNPSVENTYHLETGFLSDRSDSIHPTPRAALMGTLFNGEGSLFGDYSSPSKSQLGRNDFGLDSLGEDEPTELLFNNGDQSDSSDLSMRTRETYSRMLDFYIENGNFRSKIDSVTYVEGQAILHAEGDDNSESENAAADPEEQVPVHSGDNYLIFEDSPIDTQQSQGMEGIYNPNSQSKSNEDQSQLMSEAEESGKGPDGASKVSVLVERNVSCSSIRRPAATSETHEDAKGEETAVNVQCGNEESVYNEGTPKRSESYISPAPFKSKEKLTSELTPDDFNVVRKQIDNIPSLEMLVESSLGSVCTKASHETDRFSGGKRAIKGQSDAEQVTPSSARGVFKAEVPREPQIVVQCSGHAGNNDAVAAALRESSEVCRLLREELLDRRTKRNGSGRFQSVMEWLFLIVVVVFVTLVVVERRMDRFTFSEVRV